MNLNQIESLLHLYYSGPADAVTRAEVAGWLRERENWASFYDSLLRFEMENPVYEPDLERAFHALKASVSQNV